MKCPKCQRQITYQFFQDGSGVPVALKVCRCHLHGNERRCRDCCELEDPAAEPGLFVQVKRGELVPKSAKAKKAIASASTE